MTIKTLYKTFFGLLVKFLNQLIKLIEMVNGWYVIQQQQAGAQKQHLQQKQAEAKMTQAQLKLDLAFTSVYLYQINEQEILLAGLTPTTYHWAQVEKSKSNFKWMRCS